MNQAIRIALADDHEVVRQGIKLLLESGGPIKVVGEAAEGTQAYALVQRERPDVLLLDISMAPGQSGLTACEEIARDFPETRVLVLTMYAEPEYLYYTLRHGASGYVLKSASPADLVDAVEKVAAGKTYIDPRMADVLRRYVEANGRNGLSVLESLTSRELEVLQLLAKGYTNKEISETAFLSVKAVEAHRSRIYTKLGIKSRSELVAFALEHKLLDV